MLRALRLRAWVRERSALGLTRLRELEALGAGPTLYPPRRLDHVDDTFPLNPKLYTAKITIPEPPPPHMHTCIDTQTLICPS